MPDPRRTTERTAPPPLLPPPAVLPAPAEPLVDPRRFARLASLVEAEIVPRLLLAHRPRTDRPLLDGPDTARPEQEDVVHLAEIVVEGDLKRALAVVEEVRRRGVSVETIFLELLVPTARLLGTFWEIDRRNFSEVTIGVGVLHRIVHELSPIFQSRARPPAPDQRILLVTAPGEQHGFGLAIAAEFFRRAGWIVSGGPLATLEEILDRVRYEAFPIVGISAGSDGLIETTAQTIRAIRWASGDRRLTVLVGGMAFDGHPERVARVGADAFAGDARSAPARARALLDAVDGGDGRAG